MLCVTLDGASPNHKFFKMHYDNEDESTYCYKKKNPFAIDKERWVYLVADPPHLLDSPELFITLGYQWYMSYEGI